jgi:hypothetical protein
MLGYQGQQMSFFNPIVKDRISKTLAYFGGGLFITGALVGALRKSSFVSMNPLVLLGLTIAALIAT